MINYTIYLPMQNKNTLFFYWFYLHMIFQCHAYQVLNSFYISIKSRWMCYYNWKKINSYRYKTENNCILIIMAFNFNVYCILNTCDSIYIRVESTTYSMNSLGQCSIYFFFLLFTKKCFFKSNQVFCFYLSVKMYEREEKVTPEYPLSSKSSNECANKTKQYFIHQQNKT